MAEQMNRKNRVLAAVSGKPVDRPPVSFWGHAYHRESTARDLADATLEFWKKYDWDFIKLNPRASYHAEVWGLAMSYSGVENDKPTRVDYPVHSLDDWKQIRPRGTDSPALAEQLETIRLLRQALPDDVMLIETVFSPLSIAADLTDTPETVLAHLREDQSTVSEAVEAITRTFRPFVREVLRAGADGIYFATVDWGTHDIVTPEEYDRYARPFDLALLDEARDATFNMVHVCRQNNFLRQLADYPAHAFSWATSEPGNPTLEDGLGLIRGAVAGGIEQAHALLDSSPEAVVNQVKAGFQQTAGRRWIVAPGCSIPPQTPEKNLVAIREAVSEEARQVT